LSGMSTSRPLAFRTMTSRVKTIEIICFIFIKRRNF
jgi:hypothetical protein